jgi:16S rRNA (cytosine967-C5)-methyltransferase
MTARETAFRILLKFEQTKKHLDFLIENTLRDAPLSAKERKFVSNLVSGVIRHMTLFDWKIATFYKGNYRKTLIKFKIILRLALYEIDFLDFIPPHATVNEYVNLAKKELPKGLISTINAIIRTYLREGKGLNPEKKFKYDDTRISIRYSFPEWLVKRWLGIWDVDFVSKMCKKLNDRPIFDLRVNETKISSKEFQDRLLAANINFTKSNYFPNVYKTSEIQKIREVNLFNDGLCSAQDESGMIVTNLLEKVSPGDRILDACVAPGGKYTALYEQYSGEGIIYGLETKYDRLKKVKENCRRLGCSENLLINGDANFPPFKEVFDQIMVDAPCSGFGSIQKHPDIKWRRNLDEILSFQKLQSEILSNVSKHLKPGGFLIYSTCTIDPSENEEVIEKFLTEQNNTFRIISPPSSMGSFISDKGYIRTFPHLHEMEGSFAVKLQKIA